MSGWLELTRMGGSGHRTVFVRAGAVDAVACEGRDGSLVLLRGGGNLLVRESHDDVRCSIDLLNDATADEGAP